MCRMLVKPAQPEDAMAVALVHVRSWQAAYRGLISQTFLDQLKPEDRAVQYDFSHADAAKPYTIVAIEGGAFVGFATTMPSRDEGMQEYGELCALYVDPDWWGRSIGRGLIAAARARLAGQGFRDAMLWVLDGNDRAQRFYACDGWRPDGLERTETKWGLELHDLRFVRRLDEV